MNIVHKPIIIILLFAFVGLVLDGILFTQLVELSRKKQQALEQGEALLIQKKALDVLAGSVAAKQKDVLDLKKMFPSSLSEFVQFTDDVSAVATASSQVIIFNNDDQPAIQKKNQLNYQTEGVVIDLDGRYPDMLKFFGRVNELPYFFTLDKVSINKNQQGGGVKANLRMVLLMKQEGNNGK